MVNHGEPIRQSGAQTEQQGSLRVVLDIDVRIMFQPQKRRIPHKKSCKRISLSGVQWPLPWFGHEKTHKTISGSIELRLQL